MFYFTVYTFGILIPSCHTNVQVSNSQSDELFFSVRERDWGEYDERGVTAGVRGAASARGVSFKGENKLGVRYNNAKKNKTGGKKGSKRSAKRAEETW